MRKNKIAATSDLQFVWKRARKPPIYCRIADDIIDNRLLLGTDGAFRIIGISINR